LGILDTIRDGLDRSDRWTGGTICAKLIRSGIRNLARFAPAIFNLIMYCQFTQITPLLFLGFVAVFLTSCSDTSQEAPSEKVTVAARDIDTGETQWIDPSKLKPGPIRREALTSEQMDRIAALQKVFVEIDGQTTEQWVNNFKRDFDPDSELAVWERMARAYERYCDSKELSLDAKEEVYRVVLLRSMASQEDVLSRLDLSIISKQDAKDIMANY